MFGGATGGSRELFDLSSSGRGHKINDPEVSTLAARAPEPCRAERGLHAERVIQTPPRPQ